MAVPDHTGILKEDEVFFQMRDGDGRLVQIIVGPILVGRQPSYERSNIRKVGVVGLRVVVNTYGREV